MNAYKKLIGKNKNGEVSFPGTKPVTFKKEHIENVTLQEYCISPKFDGQRRLLFIDNDGVSYFVDQNNTFTNAKIKLCPEYQLSLLDGELITSEKGVTFIAFDMLFVKGQSIERSNYIQRRNNATDCVQLLNQYVKYDSKLIIKLNDLIYSTQSNLASTLSKFLYDRSYNYMNKQIDGLIFTRQDLPYKRYTSRTTYKWKPLRENTIDFVLKNANANEFYNLYVKDNNGDITLWDNNKYNTIYVDKFYKNKMAKVYGKSNKNYSMNNHVIECTHLPEQYDIFKHESDTTPSNTANNQFVNNPQLKVINILPEHPTYEYRYLILEDSKKRTFQSILFEHLNMKKVEIILWASLVQLLVSASPDA